MLVSSMNKHANIKFKKTQTFKDNAISSMKNVNVNIIIRKTQTL